MGTCRMAGLFLTAACLFASQPASATYFNVFNFEEEATSAANFVTYGTLVDMLNDENRSGVFIPDGVSDAVAANVIGAGADLLAAADVPAPATWLLLGAGALMLGWRRSMLS